MPNKRMNKNKRNARQAVQQCKILNGKVSDLANTLKFTRASIRDLNFEIDRLKKSAHQPAHQERQAKKWWQFWK